MEIMESCRLKNCLNPTRFLELRYMSYHLTIERWRRQVQYPCFKIDIFLQADCDYILADRVYDIRKQSLMCVDSELYRIRHSTTMTSSFRL